MAMEHPRRVFKKHVTYWDEYVATDKWYVNALLEDVPSDEINAACVDEDFSGSEADEVFVDEGYETQASLSSDHDDEDGASESEADV
jgi:hypothetical protein